tara:strand:+ start:11233 stop:11820 length:588 start_codon:yes stop_codon:yes gene_type:complete
MDSIEITNSAEKYLGELLEKQDSDTIGIKIFVSEPGSPRAETCIAYCKENDDINDYERVSDYSFSLYLENKSKAFLVDALVDYSPDKFGGTLTIKAPNAKVPSVSEDASLEERINYILYSQINPSLAAHGGEVSLVEIVDNNEAVLQFGGGCQGCGMVDVTLKDGVEKTLIEEIPELNSISDVTDHSYKDNAYYK